MSAVPLRPSRVPASSRLFDAGLASLMATLLGIPFIGLTTIDVGGQLVVQTRWGWLALVAALVFPGRLAVRWMFERRAGGKKNTERRASAVAQARPAWTARAGWIAAAMAIAIPIPRLTNPR